MPMKIGTRREDAEHRADHVAASVRAFILPLPLAHHARHTVLRVERLLIKKRIGGIFKAAGEKNRDRRRDKEEQHDKPCGRSGVFRNAVSRALGERAEDQQRNDRDDAEKRRRRHTHGGVFPQGQIFVGLGEREPPDGGILAGCEFLTLQFVLEKIVCRNAEESAEHQDLFKIGHGLRALPFGHRLPRYVHLLRQLFLRPAVLSPQPDDLVRQDHIRFLRFVALMLRRDVGVNVPFFRVASHQLTA